MTSAHNTSKPVAPAGRRPMRLLSPAGGPEQLRQAIHFGADEVYLAGRSWGMRARSKNFDRDQLAQAVRLAHASGVAVHLTLNTLMRDADVDALPDYLRFVDQIGVDAAIVADLGAMALLRRYAPHVELHVSTQASVMNALAAEGYARLGARRVVLAREMGVGEVAEVRRRLDADGFGSLELEVFAHGSMCMAVSGRCLLSSELVGRERGASFGACTQPCRWGWTLVEESRPDVRRMPVEQDGSWSYILSSNDLAMLDHLDDLAAAGVAAVKVEGRAKGAYYTACVTNAYRHVLDGEPASAWMGELDAVSHRPYSTGFFYGNPTQNPGRVEYQRDRLMVATVQDSVATAQDSVAVEEKNALPAGGVPSGGDALPVDTALPVGDAPAPRYLTEVLCRNKARVGDMLQVLSPGAPIRECRLGPLERWDEDLQVWVPASELSRAMCRYRTVLPFALEQLDILCLKQ